MEKKYVAHKIIKTIHHDAVVDVDEPWNNSPEYDTEETRYIIVSTETGEVLDDANGYGYKSAHSAYSAFAYKLKHNQSGEENMSKRRKLIIRWLDGHKYFESAMEEANFLIAKEQFGKKKFNAKFVEELLEEYNLKPDFTAAELIEAWKGR